MINWIIKLIGGGILEKVIDAFTKSEDIRVQGKQIDSDVAKTAMIQYVESQRIQNETQQAKFKFPIFWVLASLFVIPLGMWWAAILIDSTFVQIDWQVADLPTKELRDWAGQMVSFLFYTGGTVAGIKHLIGK